MSISAVLFDVYGTLLDVHGLTPVLDRLAPGRGELISTLWRQRQIDYTRLRTMVGRYEPFNQVTADGLDFACAKLGVDLPPAAREDVLRSYQSLPVHLDVRGALEALQGVRLGVLSNGTSPMLTAGLRAAGIDQHFDHVLSADTVDKYKVAPEVYQLGPQALGLPPGEIGFVSSNAWDTAGATWFGYRVFWVNRSGEPPEELGVRPEYEARSLAELPAWVKRG